VGITASAPRPESVQPFESTEAEAAALFLSSVAGVRSSTADGSAMTWTFDAGISPWMVGGTAAFSYALEGDDLTMTVQSVTAADGTVGPQPPGAILTMRRVE